jgi:putative ABC transport system permease protein
VMATVLLVGAGLLAHSFLKLSRVDTGYDPAHVLAFQLVLPQDYPTARKTAVIEDILTGLRATPGVQAAGFSYSGAFVGITNTVGYFVPPGRTAGEMHRDPDKPRLRSVSHDYLSAMGVRLREGRSFSARDDASAPWVAVINRRAARKYFGESSAVGATLIWHGPDQGSAGPVPLEVIGVMDDVRNARLDREPIGEVLLDYRQLIGIQTRWKLPTSFQEMHALGFMSFAARATGDPAAIGQAVRAVVHDADPIAGIDAMTPLEQLKSTSIAQPRFYAVMLGIFAALAGVLAAVGIYGVLAYAVLQRTPEIGVRMALGAQPRAVLALVLRRGLLLTGIGLTLGLAGAAALSRVLKTLLFGLTPLDPLTYVVVAAVFTAIATLAAYLPARRATRVDPVVALRCE